METARHRAEREASGADQPDHAPAPAASGGMAAAGPPPTDDHGSTWLVPTLRQQCSAVPERSVQSQFQGSSGRRDEGAAQSPDAGTAPPEGPPAHRLPDPAAGDAPETHGRVPEELQQQLQQQPDVGGRRVAEDLADGAVRGQGGAAEAPTAREARAARRSALQEKHLALLAQMARETELLSQQTSDEDEYAHDLEAHYERLAMVERSVLLRAPPDENADESAVDAGRTAARERRGRDEYARARVSDEFARARAGDEYVRVTGVGDGIPARSGATPLERSPNADESADDAGRAAARGPRGRDEYARGHDEYARARGECARAADAEDGIFTRSGPTLLERAPGHYYGPRSEPPVAEDERAAPLAPAAPDPRLLRMHATHRESNGGPIRFLNGGHGPGRGAPGYPRLGGLGCDDAASNAAPPASFRARAPLRPEQLTAARGAPAANWGAGGVDPRPRVLTPLALRLRKRAEEELPGLVRHRVAQERVAAAHAAAEDHANNLAAAQAAFSGRQAELDAQLAQLSASEHELAARRGALERREATVRAQEQQWAEAGAAREAQARAIGERADE